MGSWKTKVVVLVESVSDESCFLFRNLPTVTHIVNGVSRLGVFSSRKALISFIKASRS